VYKVVIEKEGEMPSFSIRRPTIMPHQQLYIVGRNESVHDHLMKQIFLAFTPACEAIFL